MLTARRVNEVGEHEVRLRELADLIGVAQVTLLRWFGNVENLLNEAHLLRLSEAEGVLALDLPAAIAAASTADAVAAALDAALTRALSEEGREQRAIVANVVSIAQGRPKLGEVVYPRLKEQRLALAEAIAEGQRRGVIPDASDPEVVAAFLRANLFGLLLIDLHPPLTAAASAQVIADVRHAVHFAVLRAVAPAAPLPPFAMGAVFEQPLSGEIELDALGTTMVDIAVELIDKHYEQNVRVTQIVEMAGVNVSQLHRRFGDFQSLLVLAQGRRLLGFTLRDLKALKGFPAGGDRASLVAFLGSLAEEVIAGARRASRLRRLGAFGGSFRRNALRAVAAGSHAQYMREHGLALDRLVQAFELGVVTYTLAMWTYANIFGLVLADVEPDPIDGERLVPLMNDSWIFMMRLHPTLNAPPAEQRLKPAEMTLSPIPKAYPPMVPNSPRNETSEAIVDAASMLMRREGAAAASTVRVAQVADVSDATIGYYFRSREQLYEAVLERAAKERTELLQSVLDGIPTDPKGAAERLMAWYLAESADPDQAAIWRQLRSLAAAENQLAERIEQHDRALMNLALQGLGVLPNVAGRPQGEPAGTAEGVAELRTLMRRLQVLSLGLQIMSPTTSRFPEVLEEVGDWVRSEFVTALSQAIRRAKRGQ